MFSEEAILLQGIAPGMGCCSAVRTTMGQVAIYDEDGLLISTMDDDEEAGGDDQPSTPPGFVAPGAVPVRADRWNLDADPATYRVAWGDTLVGLAATYLGSGARWNEIYDLNRGRIPNPDTLVAEQTVLAMPAEAADNLRDWLALGKPATKPGDLHKPGTEIVGGSRWSTGAKVAAAGAGVLLLGGLAYAATR